MNLENELKDIKKEILELKKAMFMLIKELEAGFKEITSALVGSIQKPKPMKKDYRRMFL